MKAALSMQGAASLRQTERAREREGTSERGAVTSLPEEKYFEGALGEN